jgi:hypothetical protein
MKSSLLAIGRGAIITTTAATVGIWIRARLRLLGRRPGSPFRTFKNRHLGLRLLGESGFEFVGEQTRQAPVCTFATPFRDKVQ